MKWIILSIATLWGISSWAQPRDLTPGKRKDAFGKRDFRDLANYGLQFQLGGTYLLTSNNNERIDISEPLDGFRGNYRNNPNGKLGIYGEVGMFHLPKKPLRIRTNKEENKYFVLTSYWDWGVGFKYFRGAEDIEMNQTDQLGNTVQNTTETFNFSNGNIYARASVHRTFGLKSKKNPRPAKILLDNSLGFNVDYRLTTSSDDYNTGYSFMTAEDRYYKPLHVQLHYGLGIWFTLKRGSYLVPGVRIPFLGYQAHVAQEGSNDDRQTSFGKPSLHWYSSRYWPMLFHVKYMFALPKGRKNGCPPAEINSQDRNTQNNR